MLDEQHGTLDGAALLRAVVLRMLPHACPCARAAERGCWAQRSPGLHYGACKNSGFQDVKIARIQDFKSSRIQGFKFSFGFQDLLPGTSSPKSTAYYETMIDIH